MEIFIEPNPPHPRLAIAGHVHALTSVIVASHGDHDEIALEHALQSGAPYVGLVASPRRAGSIRDYLKARGIEEKRLAALHAPAGLDIRAREPEEIAVSILAQIIELRGATESFEWRTGAAAAAGGEAEAAAAPETAVDPVCGMSVEVAGARHQREHGGTTYYFCCAGCLTRFSAEPQRFLAAKA